MAKNEKELVRQTSGAGPVDNHRVDFIGAMSLRIDQVKTFNFSVAEKTIYQTLTQAIYYIKVYEAGCSIKPNKKSTEMMMLHIGSSGRNLEMCIQIKCVFT